ncbi:hypothetical protein Tco_1569320 [Tanacetum coccineum]
MTSSNTTPVTPLSKKLSLVTHHHLLTRVPVKLDLDDWNFGTWEFFFEQLYESYEVDKFLRTPTIESSTNSITPLTPEEIKVDKIVLPWILFTLTDSLRTRLVVARPKSAKEARGLISKIVKDNKRSRTDSLKAELRSIKLGDQSMKSYFQKVDSLINILTSLDAHVNDEDVVHYVLDGLPDTYNHMRLKSRALASPMDSFSPMVLVAETSTNQHTSSTAQGSLGSLVSILLRDHVGRGASNNNTHEILTKLIAQLGNLGMHNGSTVTMPNTVTTPSNVNMPNTNTMATTVPMAFHAGPNLPVSLAHYPPPGFTPQAQLPYCYYPIIGSTSTTPPQTATQPNAPIVTNSGQATLLPQAFTIGTLHDHTTGAWNMDTCASSHLNNPVTSLSTILNLCMSSTISVGDGHSIPVTNTGHSILSTPSKSLKLNNILITPHIVKSLIYVHQFVCDNYCTIKFDSFGFSVKDFKMRRVLLRCDSTGYLYSVTTPSPIPSAFLVSQQTWHQ